jgi:hypothetical protein
MELVLIICHVAFFMACPINIIVAYQSKNKHAFCGWICALCLGIAAL